MTKPSVPKEVEFATQVDGITNELYKSILEETTSNQLMISMTQLKMFVKSDEDYSEEIVKNLFGLAKTAINGYVQTANKNLEETTYLISDTLKKKNADYGNSMDKSMADWGVVALAVRLEDKLNRYKNLVKNDSSERQVSDEAIEDTLLDLAGYAILGYRYLQNEKNLTLKSTKDANLPIKNTEFEDALNEVKFKFYG